MTVPSDHSLPTSSGPSPKIREGRTNRKDYGGKDL